MWNLTQPRIWCGDTCGDTCGAFPVPNLIYGSNLKLLSEREIDETHESKITGED